MNNRDCDRDAARLGRFEVHAMDATLIGFPEYADRVQYNVHQGLYDISLRNSLNKGGVKAVPGAPMCGW